MSSDGARKTSRFSYLPLSTTGEEDCALMGQELLRSPYFNKGSAFPEHERETFQLQGLLPANVQTLDEQVSRAYQQYCSRHDDLAKNTFMSSLKDQNEVLYYKLIHDHLKEMFSVIYTPTEGDAIQNFSTLFRKPAGCFLNILEPSRIRSELAQFGESSDIDYIVVTDGEQILGIGDQGVGGILISVAKLVLTTLCAGIHPARTLAVVLDCGTDNRVLLDDELYLGLRRPRIRGDDYDSFVDTFVRSARELYPRAYIHFEDFALLNARRILDKYRPEMACFNDDVQGTGCVTLAGVLAGLHVADIPLSDMRLVLFGAGTAGTGIAEMVRDAISSESGKSKEEAAQQIWCFDKAGLLLKSQAALTPSQVPFARCTDSVPDTLDPTSLLSLINTVHPHVLIGTSTQPKSFTEPIIRAMAAHTARPIVFPLSNPTRLHEASPHDINAWTNGRALIATGSPFPPVTRPDGKQYEIAECNNSTCFPGIGLGCVLSRTSRLTDRMLVAAVKELAAASPALKDPEKGLLPDVTDVRELSVKIAMAVITQAVEEGLAQETGIPDKKVDLEEWVREQMWAPRYRDLRRIEKEGAGRFARGELGHGAHGGAAR